MESTNGNSFLLLSEVCMSLGLFHETDSCSGLFSKTSCAGLNEKKTDDIASFLIQRRTDKFLIFHRAC